MKLREFSLQKLLGALSSSLSRPILAHMGQSSCFASRMWLSHKISKVSGKQQLILQLHQKHFTHSTPLSLPGQATKTRFSSQCFMFNFLLFSPQHTPVHNFLQPNAAINISDILFTDTECDFVTKTTSFTSNNQMCALDSPEVQTI